MRIVTGNLGTSRCHAHLDKPNCADMPRYCGLYLLNRVFRQFGYHQTILLPVDTNEEQVHHDNLGGRTGMEWDSQWVRYVDTWNNRVDYVFLCHLMSCEAVMLRNDPYFHWYYAITHRIVCNLNHEYEHVFQGNTRVMFDVVLSQHQGLSMKEESSNIVKDVKVDDKEVGEGATYGRFHLTTTRRGRW